MINIWNRIARVLIITILLTGITGLPVHAFRGIPGSPEFGVGARLSMQPENLDDAAITLTAKLKPDWLLIETDWTRLSPEPGVEPDWSKLDITINKTKIQGSAVMLSLTNPPPWTLTSAGPDPSITADFISALVSRFGNSIGAVELFPAPNTSTGWGASPNPSDYFTLFQAVKQQLDQQGNPLLLVSGGLETNISTDDPGAWSDLDYLAGLYSLGANTAMPVIGLRYSSINGLPSAYPRQGESNVLRHYEAVRRIMTANGHVSGILWITYLGFPSGTTPLEQTEWLSEAYPLIRTQLYIGAAFLQGINTCIGELPDCSEVSLLSQAGVEHPFTPVLHGIIARNTPNVKIPGREKSIIFQKPR
jgi:hypothetical protein